MYYNYSLLFKPVGKEQRVIPLKGKTYDEVNQMWKDLNKEYPESTTLVADLIP